MHTTASVLVIGLDPYRVPGPWDPAPVADAIAVGMARFAAPGSGWRAAVRARRERRRRGGRDEALDSRPWEVVVVGGGVRKPEDQLDLFERVVNLVHRHAPGAAIAFNNTPADTFDAAARWLDPQG